MSSPREFDSVAVDTRFDSGEGESMADTAEHSGITVTIPGSKSMTHRAFLLAAQSPEGCVVVNPLLADDTRATLSCLRAMGARFECRDSGVHFEALDTPCGARGCTRLR